MKKTHSCLKMFILAAAFACGARAGFAQGLDMLTKSLQFGAGMETSALKSAPSVDRIMQRLKIQGYTDITAQNSGQPGDQMHFFANTPEGEAVDLAIDPTTGGIISATPRGALP
ncbi:MAG: hypothetical protein P4M13_05045 [Alphaproteobacteria bacterium]|nr:hypothetical protein [Alphaproteobacteria bacterium]